MVAGFPEPLICVHYAARDDPFEARNEKMLLCFFSSVRFCFFAYLFSPFLPFPSFLCFLCLFAFPLSFLANLLLPACFVSQK